LQNIAGSSCENYFRDSPNKLYRSIELGSTTKTGYFENKLKGIMSSSSSSPTKSPTVKEITHIQSGISNEWLCDLGFNILGASSMPLTWCKKLPSGNHQEFKIIV
jgi:hypothetical protein